MTLTGTTSNHNWTWHKLIILGVTQSCANSLESKSGKIHWVALGTILTHMLGGEPSTLQVRKQISLLPTRKSTVPGAAAAH